MSFLAAIREILITDTDITDLVQTKIYWNITPQRKDAPYLVLEKLRNDPNESKEKPSQVDFVDVDITIVAKNVDIMEKIGDKVRSRLEVIREQTFKGKHIQHISFDDERNRYNDSSQCVELTQEYVIFHQRTI